MEVGALFFGSSGSVKDNERIFAHVTMVMSGDDEVGLFEGMAEGAIDESVEASFAGRDDGMMHEHDDVAVIGTIHGSVQPSEGACEIDESFEGVGVDSDDTHLRQVHVIGSARYAYGSVMRIGEGLFPHG